MDFRSMPTSSFFLFSEKAVYLPTASVTANVTAY